MDTHLCVARSAIQLRAFLPGNNRYVEKGSEALLLGSSAPHLFFGKGMNRPARFWLGTRLEHRLCQEEVGLRCDLHIGRRTFDHMYRVSGGLDQLSVISDVLSDLRSVGISLNQPIAPENLRSLGKPQSLARHGFLDDMLSIDTFQCIAYRPRQQSGAGFLGLCEDGVNHFLGQARTYRIMGGHELS